jgi:hypothetical protein
MVLFNTANVRPLESYIYIMVKLTFKKEYNVGKNPYFTKTQ